MDERDARMARNEVLFREVNERVNDLSDELRDYSADYFCECANIDCTYRVPLSAREYEAIRQEPTQFVVLPDHFTPEVEELVVQGDRFWVVRKTGEAGEMVKALDPRA